MLLLGVVLGLTGLVIFSGIMLVLRSVVRDEETMEEQLRAPGAHTLEFEVPNGMDPAVLKAALAGEHFTSITRNDGGTERLAIACEEQDRSSVRHVLEHVHAASAAGSDAYLGQVHFSDEAGGTSRSRVSVATPARTTVAEPIAYGVDAHRRRYLISMAIRTVCVVAAVLSIGHWFLWAFLVGAIVLPYVAVIEAN